MTYALVDGLNVHGTTMRWQRSILLQADWAAGIGSSTTTAVAGGYFGDIVPLVGGIAVCAVVSHAARPRKVSICLLTLAVVGIMSNPLLEHAKVALVSNPENYTFVASDQPYRFEGVPALRLASLSGAQETSEAITILAILAALLVARRNARRGYPAADAK
jgi:ABC-type Fe3+-siderophore transport system permease subunit